MITDEMLLEYSRIDEPVHCELVDLARELIAARARIRQLEQAETNRQYGLRLE